MASSAHELARCLEVGSITDNAEMILMASLERKESRKVPFRFSRADFPEQDDNNYFAFMALRKDGETFKFKKIGIQELCQ